jgi:hypothetical protein
MKRIISILSLVICVLIFANGQSNLVLNPSFENHYDTFDLGIASFRNGFVDDWSDPNHGSSDYFVPNSAGMYATPPNNGFGFEYPRSGYCYGGFIFYENPPSTSYEYIQASFNTPLIAGKTYAIECYVSLLGTCLSELGFYFSSTQVSFGTGQIIPYTAQSENPSSNLITTHDGWQRITANYTALGGEKYMSIGNFTDYALCHIDTCSTFGGVCCGSYLFVDDVAVYDTSKVDTIQLCINDSVQIGNLWQHNEGIYSDLIGGLPVQFFIQHRPFTANLSVIYKPFLSGDSVRVSLLQTAGIDSIEFLNNFLWIKSDTMIDIPMFNIYGCDSTVRYVCGTNIGINHVYDYINWSVFPNPANDYLQITLNNNDPNSYSINIIDITGKEVKSLSISNAAIDISLLKSGMYFAKLLNTKTGKVVGNEKFVKE